MMATLIGFRSGVLMSSYSLSEASYTDVVMSSAHWIIYRLLGNFFKKGSAYIEMA